MSSLYLSLLVPFDVFSRVYYIFFPILSTFIPLHILVYFLSYCVRPNTIAFPLFLRFWGFLCVWCNFRSMVFVYLGYSEFSTSVCFFSSLESESLIAQVTIIYLSFFCWPSKRVANWTSKTQIAHALDNEAYELWPLVVVVAS